MLDHVLLMMHSMVDYLGGRGCRRRVMLGEMFLRVFKRVIILDDDDELQSWNSIISF